MQVFQTAGVPPSNGRIILPISGWKKKKREALTNSVRAKKSSIRPAAVRAVRTNSNIPAKVSNPKANHPSHSVSSQVPNKRHLRPIGGHADTWRMITQGSQANLWTVGGNRQKMR